jgi:transposase-like protein
MTTRGNESAIRLLPLADVIREHCEMVVRESSSLNAAYKTLGVGRATLFRWRKRWRREDRLRAAGARSLDRRNSHDRPTEI